MVKTGTIGKKITLSSIFFFCTFLSFSSFGQDPFTIRGDAVRRSQRCFTITSNQNNKSGAVWFKDLLDLSQPLELNFVIYMGDKDNNGADGIAFVMHTDLQDTLGGGAFGDVGGGLGYSRHTSQTNTKKILPSVAIEFDTWNNGTTSGDIAEDHTAVVYNGDVYNGTQQIIDDKGNLVYQTPIKPSAIYAVQNVENDECYHYRITWDPATQVMELFIDGYKIFTFTDDIITKVFSGATNVRYGFTGSTGGSRNEQTICLFGGNTPPYASDDAASTLEVTPVTINITANDHDPDGDELQKSVIVVPPTKGVVSVLSPDKIKYTPNNGFVGTDSLKYMTCDVNSVKCYAKCDTATVYINVQCVSYNINAIQLSSNNKCVDSYPNNGAAQAYFTPPASGPGSGFLASDFTYRWYQGGAVKATPDYTGAIINNIPEGLYTVVARNNFTGCLSNPTQVTIDRERNNPEAVIWQIAPFTSCGIPDGILQSGVSVLSGTDTITTGYNFIWYENDFILTGDTVAVGPLATQLQAKKYAVVVTDQTSGCDTIVSSEVPSNVSIPLASASVTAHITTCINPLDGEVQANVGGLTAGYTFSWYKGSMVKPVADYIENAVDSLPVGNYTVTATHNITTCVSDPVTITVQDMTNAPDIIATVISNQLSCDPNNPTGAASAAVNVGGVPTTTGFRFYWHKGLNDVVPAIPGQVGEKASNCGSGGINYPGEIWLEAECGTMGSKWEQLNDANASEGKYARIKNGNNNNGSAPTGANDRVRYNFTVSQPGMYKVWGRVSITGGGNDSFWVRMDGGTWIKWNEIASGASWHWDEVHDADNSKQVVNFNLLAGNHTLDIAFREDGTLLDKIFIGKSNNSPSNGTPGSSVSNLPAGTYRVVAIDNATGCKSVQDVTIINTPVFPVVALTNKTDQTLCSTLTNGSASVNVSSNTSNYDFYWFNGTLGIPDTTSAGMIFKGASITGIAAGDYTVVAADKLYRCASSPFYVTIEDNTVLPNINPSVLAEQTACDPLLVNGQLRGAVDASAIGSGVNDTNHYTFEWYTGVLSMATLPATPYATGSTTASNLAAGDYTLVVTNDTTQCQNLDFINLPDNPIKPTIDAAITVVDATRCDDPWGSSISVTADTGMTAADGYTFQWTQVTPFTPLAETTETLSNIPPGDYEVLVTNNLGCPADNAETVTVLPAPLPAANAVVLAEQTACDPTLVNGSLGGSVDASAVGGGATDINDYTFVWYNGIQTLGALPPTTLPMTDVISGLAADDYTLVVTNDTTHCQNLDFINLPDNPIKPVIDATITVIDTDRCSDPWGSSITVTADGGKTIANGYEFQWTQVTPLTPLAETSEVLTNIPPGAYEVMVTNDLKCIADNPVTVTVNDGATYPTVFLSTVNNTACTGANGAITAFGFSGVAIDYTFEWFENNTSGPAVASANITADGDTVLNLATLTYALRIIENINDCPTEAYATINNVPAIIPVLDTLRTQATTDCRVGFADGEAVFTIAGGSNTIPPANTLKRTFTYEIYTGAVIVGFPVDTKTHTDSVTFSNLNLGDYTVRVMDNYNNCWSAPMTITIKSDPSIDINLNTLIPSSSCTPGIGTGEFTLEASSPLNSNPTGAGYTFSWYYRGYSSIGPPPGTANPGTAGLSTAFTSERKALDVGYYTLEVSDNLTSCIYSEDFFMPIADSPELTIVDTTSTTQCNPGNGSVEIRLAQIGASQPPDQYIVHLFKGNSIDFANSIETWTPTSSTLSDNYTFSGLSQGNYLIAVQENFMPSTCYAEQKTFTIKLVNPAPTIPVTKSPDFSCNPAVGTGQLIAAAVGGGSTAFSYEWYTGSDTLAAPGFSISANPSSLRAGLYSVKVIDTDGQGLGCRYKKTVNLDNIPKNIQISSTNIVHNDQCTPDANGQVNVTQIRENNVVVTTPGDYTFTLLDNSLAATAYVGNGTSGIPFVNLPPATYYVRATNSITACETTKATVVKDISKAPTPIISLEQPDFSCDGILPTGILVASATDPVSGDNVNFTFDWFSGNGIGTPLAVANIDAGNAARAIDLLGGQTVKYTIQVTDTDDTGKNCTSTKVFTLNKKKRIQTLLMVTADQDRCAPDVGAIIITDVEEKNTFDNTASTNNLGIYEFELFDQDPNISLISLPSGSSAFSNLAVGSYHVKGTNTGTDNCTSLPFPVTINDISEDPEIDIALIQPDFSCDGIRPTGELTATGSDPKDGATTAFSYKWFAGADTTGLDVSLTANATNLLQGTYTVKVIDTNGTGNNCESTKTITLNKKDRKIDLALSSTPQTICVPPNGIITVDQVTEQDTYNGTQTALLSNYDFYLFQDPADPSIATAAANSFTDLGAGTYFARGINAGTDGCTSLPFSAKIIDTSKNPIVDIAVISKQFSSNPDPATWTGELAGVVNVHPSNPLDSTANNFSYSYAWYEDTYNPGAEISTTSSASGLDSGLYVLEVTNLFTNCSSSAARFLEKAIPEIVITYNGIPQTICFPDGSIEVTNITINGNISGNVSDYSFTLSQGSYPGDTSFVANGAITGSLIFDSLNAEQSFYLVAYDNKLQAISGVVQVDIEDLSTLPNIDLDLARSQDQNSCDPTVLLNGALAVNVYENDFTQDIYTYQWFTGKTVDATYLMTDSTSTSIRGLGAGYYSVWVANQLTGCENNTSFFVKEDIRIPQIAVSSAPSTYCGTGNGNGTAVAYVSNASSTYYYEWYLGNQVKSQADHTGEVWNGLDPGFYTVKVTDRRIGTCTSTPATVEVLDASEPPAVIITQTAPLSNCDPNRPNAELRATVDGQVDGFKFAWYNENNQIINIGAVAANLQAITYRVEALDLTTNCIAEATATVTEDIKAVPPPSVEVLSDMNRCDVPDGAAGAHVGGSTTEHIFDWYTQQGKPITHEVNHIAENLMAGAYYVTATDRKTGCVSEPVSFSIADKTFLPEFTVSAEPALCEKEDGKLKIVTTVNDLSVDQVIWYSPLRRDIISRLPEVNELPVGYYPYDVIGSNGCIRKGNAEIGVDINVFNGVSPNGDGDNDFFEIGCIEDYPNNSVKLFNRAGTLVYDATGYDNHSILFDGYGNRGVYVGGKELPDGTYFYIIEKKNGTKPRTGYLEIVR